jgi:hypothetical protein
MCCCPSNRKRDSPLNVCSVGRAVPGYNNHFLCEEVQHLGWPLVLTLFSQVTTSARPPPTTAEMERGGDRMWGLVSACSSQVMVSTA